MPFDAAAVRCTAFEINKLIEGGKIEKVYQPEKDEIVLVIKTREGSFRLVISANGANPRIYITKSTKENPDSPPMFCMLMRKHVSSGRITGVKSVDFERIIDIGVESRNEMGDAVEKHIMCEIMGKNSNIILTDEKGKIIDSVKHVDISVSRVRNIFPGLTYSLPPDGERKNPLLLNEEELFEVISLAGDGKNADKALPGVLSGLSPLFVREALFKAIGTADYVIGEMSEEDKRRFARALYEMLSKVRENDFSSVVLYREGEKKPMDFAVYPIEQYGEGFFSVKAESVCEAMEIFYSEKDAVERMRSRSYALMKNVTSQLERVRKKISLLHVTLKESADREKHKIAGDIITANLYRMNKGDKVLTAINYYDENQSEITISLDEALYPAENAQRYYKKYSKAKTAEVEAAKQMEKAIEEEKYLESVVNEIERAATPSELEEIRGELILGNVIKNYDTKKKTNKKKSVSPPVEYEFLDYVIYSGKNNVQNDYLTMKIGRATDLWLHAKNIPGSHVLVKSKGEDFPNKVIEAAAIIAATNSKGAKSEKVDIDYCPVSHVRKPNGSKAGMVIYEGYSTATVSPDEDFCESIRKK